ncbi:MAG: MBL fold metallo-hydrolase [Rhodothermales bacterium]|nr:MBL fold metallo-hydrolase [Rhodothermales bacterium]
MIVQKYTFNPFQTNTFIIHSGSEAVLIDASAHMPEEFDLIESYISENKLTVKALLLTHGHIDHIMGCAHLTETYGMPWMLNPADKPFVDRAQDQARMFGVEFDPRQIKTTPIKEGDSVRFGDVDWSVLETPGHSPGSVSFVDEENEVVISGDVLFNGSIGRTDLLFGSMPVLMQSIYQKLIPLGDQFKVLCGHGPDTIIGHERAMNPFLQG